MDWFERITGFKERGYKETQSQLELVGTKLRSRANKREFEIGEFSMPSLAELRNQVKATSTGRGRLKVSTVSGDVRSILASRENHGALFQVASQFNMLEMISPSRTPEDGVTLYEFDQTQGPACAIAAGAATIYRNYLVPCGGVIGQGDGCQLNGLADIGQSLSEQLAMPVEKLWRMRNGYALCTSSGLKAINALICDGDESLIDDLRSKLKIGVHTLAQVTDVEDAPPHLVSQAFCSALPVAYSDVPMGLWTSFAQLVLDAAYEATLLLGVVNAARSQSNLVYLTRLGGGAFGNDEKWIHAAISRALDIAADHDLDVRIVTYRPPSQELRQIAKKYAYYQ